MRHARRVLVTAVSSAVLGVVATSPVTASCAGPTLDVAGAQVRYDSTGAEPPAAVLRQRAGTIVVTGTAFGDGRCDGPRHVSGCRPPPADVPPTPPAPARDVRLLLSQGERTWRLGTADARSTGHGAVVRWEVELPPELEPGSATLTAEATSVRATLELEVPGP